MEPDEIMLAEATAAAPAGDVAQVLGDQVADQAIDQVLDDVEPQQGTVRRFLGNMWGRLTKPTTRKVTEYADRQLAAIVNEELDKGAAGPAHKAQLGEATTLVVEHLMEGDGAAESPLGILFEHGTRYGYERWNAKRHPEAEA